MDRSIDPADADYSFTATSVKVALDVDVSLSDATAMICLRNTIPVNNLSSRI